MSRRRSSVDWSYLRGLIEFNLPKHPEFHGGVQVKGNLDYCGGGLFHDNYAFGVGESRFVLRLAKRRGSLRSQNEATASLQREAETLRRLGATEFLFLAPELVCIVSDESGEQVGLIETHLDGLPLSDPAFGCSRDPLMAVAHVAAAIHQLPHASFAHLPASQDSGAHVAEHLSSLSHAIIDEFPAASLARSWILKNAPQDRPSVVLHGDLLPQNLLLGWSAVGEEHLSVVDWEAARIGDPAYDLAIVTRGARNPLKQPGGLGRMVSAYNKLRGTDLPVSAVQVHELLLHLSWLCEAAEQERKGRREGHGPEYYESAIASILRRVK